MLFETHKIKGDENILSVVENTKNTDDDDDDNNASFYYENATIRIIELLSKFTENDESGKQLLLVLFDEVVNEIIPVDF